MSNADMSQHGIVDLWESWKKENGTLLGTFTINTTDPNKIIKPLHARMPVFIKPKDYDRWLQQRRLSLCRSIC